jgi:hypothetical protein
MHGSVNESGFGARIVTLTSESTSLDATGGEAGIDFQSLWTRPLLLLAYDAVRPVKGHKYSRYSRASTTGHSTLPVGTPFRGELPRILLRIDASLPTSHLQAIASLSLR